MMRMFGSVAEFEHMMTRELYDWQPTQETRLCKAS